MKNKTENTSPSFATLFLITTFVVLAIIGVVVIAIAVAKSLGLTMTPQLIFTALLLI